MPYDARQIANWFICRARSDNRLLTIMSVLKLTYIAHGWHLALYDEPLFTNRIEAWRYGPVIPDIYNTFRPMGVTLKEPITGLPYQVEQKTENFLEQIYNLYSDMHPLRLSSLTHAPSGPWDITSRLAGDFSEIPNDLIRQHYLLKQQAAEQSSAK